MPFVAENGSAPIATARMPKVLQVTGSLDTGGAEMMVVSAAEALAGKCEMDFLVFSERKGTLEDRALSHGRVWRLPSPRHLGPSSFLRELTRLLRTEQYDVVHSHINLASGVVMKAAEKAGVPIRIAHSHSSYHPATTAARRAYRYIAQRRILRHSTVYAACGEEAGRGLFGQSWHRGGGVVVPNGVDLQRFLLARDAREEAREALGIRAETLAIGMIARLIDVKNHEFMLRLLADEEVASSNWVLLIVGAGPLRQTLEQLATQLGIAERVRFLGLRDDVPAILGALDFLAMPSIFEGLPVALLEAQATGVKALVSDQVDPASDLGLGLVRWLSLGDATAWLRALGSTRAVPTPSIIEEKFIQAGYDLKSAAARWLDLYRLDTSRP